MSCCCIAEKHYTTSGLARGANAPNTLSTVLPEEGIVRSSSAIFFSQVCRAIPLPLRWSGGAYAHSSTRGKTT